MMAWRGAFAGVLAVLGVSGAAQGAVLNGIAPGLLSISDGTSNTILFGESTRASVCVSGATGSIVDGTSNTILFGESGGFMLRNATVLPHGRVRDIADGTSNTILFGETPSSFCLAGGRIGDPVPLPPDGTGNTIVIGPGARLDLCVTGAEIGDGTSNTILFRETFCVENVSLAPDAVITPAAVPVPPTLGLALAGLGALGALRQRRRS